MGQGPRNCLSGEDILTGGQIGWVIYCLRGEVEVEEWLIREEHEIHVTEINYSVQ